MKCGPIVFLFLLAFICTFSEGKSCTGQRLTLFTADNTDSVKNCINRGGKCCSVSKDGDFVTWDGGSDIMGSCELCWSGKSRSDLNELLENKSCTGQRLPQFTADNTASVKNCINGGGKCCSVSKDGDFVTWDGGSDMSGSCDMCWSGKSRSDLYELLEKLVEKIFDKMLDKACDKTWDKMSEKFFRTWDKMSKKYF